MAKCFVLLVKISTNLNPLLTFFIAPSFSLFYSFKSGKVVIVLAGRFAGRKAVVVKASDDGKEKKNFGHALVAGIDRYPRKITKTMKKEKQEKRSKIKPFIKVLNYQHIMPTRYSVDMDLKKQVEETGGIVREKLQDTRKGLKKVFEAQYKNQSAKGDKKSAGLGYFFTKLRF
jgi:large subunit ribosomal protein L27e